MSLHDFIFSQEKGKRLQRHLLFWGIWWLFLFLCDYLYQLPVPGEAKIKPFYLNVGDNPLLKLFLLVVVYAIACYAIIYFLLPLVTKRKWIKAISLLIPITGFLYVATHFLFWNIFPFIDTLTGSGEITRSPAKFWPAFNLGLIAPLKIISSVIIIKYIKGWWLKQKESERLEREKINAELQLLKGQIQPGILLNTLNNIYDYSKAGSPRASELLLKLSDLLSYMLYECEGTFVPLEKEIDMMKGYITIEKYRRDNDIEIEVNVKDNLNGKLIAPFLLFPFIENSFKQSKNRTEQAWINLDVSITNDFLIMKLANGIAAEMADQQPVIDDSLINVQKRLALLYPQQHELKITREQEMLIVFLRIHLIDEKITEPGKIAESAIDPFERQPTAYAAQ